MIKNLFIGVLLSVFLLCNFSMAAQEESPDEKQSYTIKENTMVFPHKREVNKWDFSIGASLTKLPFDWVETAMNAPMFNFHVNYGLPYGFSLSGDVLSLIISNQFRVGPRWNCELGDFAFNAGYDAAFMFGYMWFAGFNDKMRSVFTYPNVSVGYNLGKIALTLEGEVMFINWMRMTAGDEETNINGSFFTGGSVGLFVEQRIYKEKAFVIGLKGYYTKFFFLAWPAFSTFDRFYFLPELSFAVKL